MALCHGSEVLMEQLKANYFLQKSKQSWVRVREKEDYKVCWAVRTVLCVDNEAKDQEQSKATRGKPDPKPVADVPFLVADAVKCHLNSS